MSILCGLSSFIPLGEKERPQKIDSAGHIQPARRSGPYLKSVESSVQQRQTSDGSVCVPGLLIIVFDEALFRGCFGLLALKVIAFNQKFSTKIIALIYNKLIAASSSKQSREKIRICRTFAAEYRDSPCKGMSRRCRKLPAHSSLASPAIGPHSPAGQCRLGDKCSPA